MTKKLNIEDIGRLNEIALSISALMTEAEKIIDSDDEFSNELAFRTNGNHMGIVSTCTTIRDVLEEHLKDMEE